MIVTLQDLAPDLAPLSGAGAVAGGFPWHREPRAACAALRDQGLGRHPAAGLRRAGPGRAARVLPHHRRASQPHARAHRDLLDAGRIEAGTLSVAPEPSEVAALVDRARSTFLSAGGRHTVLIDLPPDLPRVMADRPRIVQVLNNLLSNAARHSPHSAPIRVAAERDGAHVAVSVRDEGRGVAPARAAAAPVPQVRARRRRRPGGRLHEPRAHHLQGAGRGARRPHPGRERRDRPRAPGSSSPSRWPRMPGRASPQAPARARPPRPRNRTSPPRPGGRRRPAATCATRSPRRANVVVVTDDHAPPSRAIRIERPLPAMPRPPRAASPAVAGRPRRPPSRIGSGDVPWRKAEAVCGSPPRPVPGSMPGTRSWPDRYRRHRIRLHDGPGSRRGQLATGLGCPLQRPATAPRRECGYGVDRVGRYYGMTRSTRFNRARVLWPGTILPSTSRRASRRLSDSFAGR